MKYDWEKIKKKVIFQKPLVYFDRWGKVMRFYLIVLAFHKKQKIPQPISLGGDNMAPLLSYDLVNPDGSDTPTKTKIEEDLQKELSQAKFRLKHIALNSNIEKIEPANIPTEYQDILEFYYK